MKFAFSTIGCPEWSWKDMIATAKDLGYDGIEIRGIANELYVPKTTPFLPENIAATKKLLKEKNLEISMLTSACSFHNKNTIARHMAGGREYIDLAHEVGVPFIRVMCEQTADPQMDIDLAFVSENYAKLAEYAKGSGVTVLMETNGALANTKKMKSFIAPLEAQGLPVGVLWDIHHPFRFFGESIQTTYDNIGEFVKYIHIKDSVMENGEVKYKMLGKGDIPNRELLIFLNNNHYKSYVSLEWVRRWNKDLEAAGIVFPQFIQYVRRIVK